MLFFPGIHQPSDGRHFKLACISINRLLSRRKPVGARWVLVDSGAFTELHNHGRYRMSAEHYAGLIFSLWQRGVVRILGVVAQDYMCEPFILAKTGMTVLEHQRLTIERYDAFLAELLRLFGVGRAEQLPFRVIPVLQGWAPADYVRHILMYGARLARRMWVGVGSVCKRQGVVSVIETILSAIKAVRPDLRLHGFGVKIIALLSHLVRRLLFTADSMAWSYAARREGRNGNDYREALTFSRRVMAPLRHAEQLQLPLGLAA